MFAAFSLLQAGTQEPLGALRNTHTSGPNQRRPEFSKHGRRAEAEAPVPASLLSCVINSAATQQRVLFQLMNNEKGPGEKTPSAPL